MDPEPSFTFLAASIDFGLLEILFVILLVLFLSLSALCSANETALSSVNDIRLKQLSQSGSKKQRKRAKRALELQKRYGTYLNTILIFNNILNLAASNIATYILIDSFHLGENAVLISTIVMSILIIVFSEILPKNLAKVYPEKVCLNFSLFLKIIAIIFRPISFFLDKVNDQIAAKADSEEERVSATEDELEDFVEKVEKEGVLEHQESELIINAMHLDEKSVNSIMVDKSNVNYIDIDATFTKIVQYFKTINNTRVPVLKNDKVVGTIHQKDVFNYIGEKTLTDSEKKKKVIRDPVFISYRKTLDYALERSQRSLSHMLIVVDNMKDKEYMGIVTLEDILEELVGEIYDEHDLIPKDVYEIGNHIFKVSGGLDLDDLFSEYLEDTTKPKTTIKTVGSWIIKLFNDKNVDFDDTIEYENLKITIDDYDEKRKIVNRVEIEELTEHED
jgi:CBS domain containing-hemolysin-like protein